MCHSYNTPIRRSSDGCWVNYSTNQTINLDGMWHKGQPNGQPIEECLSYSKTGQFHDTRCETSDGCFVCVWRNEPTFTLRGLCSETTIDRDYVLLPNRTYDQNVLFWGFYKNIILFNRELDARLIVENAMEDLFDSSQIIKPTSIMGTLLYGQDENQMPIGLHVWNITDCKGKTFGKLTSVSPW